MAKFLVLYKSTVPADQLMAESTPEQMQEGMNAWMAWAGRCGDALVDMGSPLGTTAAVPAGSVSESDEQVSGFSVLEADSMATATALVEGHPHFMTPGAPTILVFEYLPVPGS